MIYPANILETNEGFNAYIPESKFNKIIIEQLNDKRHLGKGRLELNYKNLENINRNSKWEKNFSPISS